MRKNEIEKSLKRFLKRKVSYSVSLLVAFMITGGIAAGAGIDVYKRQGQDPENNLYWGCAYGIKTYFKRSKEWKFIKSEKLNSIVLERVVFKHITEKDTYLVADAYDGRYIKECTKDFLSASSGIEKNTIELNGKTIGIDGNAGLI